MSRTNENQTWDINMQLYEYKRYLKKKIWDDFLTDNKDINNDELDSHKLLYGGKWVSIVFYACSLPGLCRRVMHYV